MKELLDLEPNECRFSMNDGGPHLFCAKDKLWHIRNGKLVQSSYCRDHHFICSRASELVPA